MELKVLTYNTLFAGHDGTDERRAQVQIEPLNDVAPDVFMMQEARGFDANGGAWMYAMERQIDMRGFLALAPRTDQHVAIFIRDPLKPLAFDSDSDQFHHALGKLLVSVPGTDQPVTFICTHLCPNGPAVRLREVAHLAVQALPDKLSLITGDFNSASAHDPQPDDWNTLSAHHRARYFADDMSSIDHTALSHLEAAGWVDLGHRLDPVKVPTVPTSAYRHAEFATMRCDYLLASQALANKARIYRVIRNASTDAASDHYPVLATFDLTS